MIKNRKGYLERYVSGAAVTALLMVVCALISAAGIRAYAEEFDWDDSLEDLSDELYSDSILSDAGSFDDDDDDEDGEWYRITSTYAEGIALHPEPDKDSEVLTRLPYDTEFYVTDWQDDYGYTEYDGYEGWINLDYAEIIFDTSWIYEEEGEWYLITSTYEKGIALHPEPDKDSEVLTRLPYETEFYVIDWQDNYGYTEYDGQEGWINLDYAESLEDYYNNYDYGGEEEYIISYGNAYLAPDSSYRYLTESEISGWSAKTLCYARNEIYARHGRGFDSEELTAYFNSQSWYLKKYDPEDFPASLLNKYENANVQLLLEREYELCPGGYQLDRNTGNGSAGSYGSAYIIADSSYRYLTKSEISGWSARRLCYARNEIYARYGRGFNSEELTVYFSSQSWYTKRYEPEDFPSSLLNKYENANVQLLLEREYELCPGGYQLDSDAGSGSGGSYESNYILSDSSYRYLSESEISGLSAKTLCYARNEVYARHGRGFNSKELTAYFNSRSWYTKLYEPEDFPSSLLNKYEKANVELLLEREYELCPGGYQLDQ